MSPPENPPSDNSALCPWWLGGLLDNSVRRLLHNPQLILGGRVKRGQRAADVGAGSGFFSLPLADLVGDEGRVYAVDLQPGMLRQIARKAARRKQRNLVTCRSHEASFSLPEPVDFILCFWMLHEVAEPGGMAVSLREALNPDGTLLFAEPKIHVPEPAFQRETALLTAAGFRVRESAAIRWSRSLLLEKI